MKKTAEKKDKKQKKAVVLPPFSEMENVHLMVDFTAMQLNLCYDKLSGYPDIQEDISNLIRKLAKI